MVKVSKLLTDEIVKDYLKDIEQQEKYKILRVLWDGFVFTFGECKLTYTVIDGHIDYIQVLHLDSKYSHEYSIACDSCSATFRDTCEAMIKLAKELS